MTSKQPFIVTRILTFSFIYAALSLTIILNIISVQPAFHQLLDFGSFIAAGKEAMEGQNPYAIDSPLVYRVESQNAKRVLPSPNLNPPVSILVFRALHDIDPLKAASGWRIATAILFAIGVLILATSYPNARNPARILWALSLAAFWNTLGLGQIYAPISILAISAWILLERGHHKLAGLALGAIIAIKPNLVFWLALLAVAGYTMTVLSAVVVALVLSILPVLIFGPGLYQQWLTALSNYPSIGLLIAGNTSFQSLTARFGSSLPGTAISLLLIGGSLYMIFRNKKTLSEINTLGIVGSLLISPFSWTGYTMLTLPIFFSKPNWSWHDTLSAAILSFPYVFILYFFEKSFFNSVLFGWFYGWGLLLILAGLILKKDHPSDKSMENQV